ncbi:MAG: WG repeat-containing protein [Firmicutes bacterium]|nr:WG repeat-containing protein [Bacillota bacterium]
MEYYNEGITLTVTDQGARYTDKMGDVLYENPSTDALPFSEGLAMVYFDGAVHYIDSQGFVAIALSAVWQKGRSFHDGRAAVYDGQYWGYIDSDGEVAVTAEWDEADDFENGIANVVKDGVPMQIDLDGWTIEEDLFSVPYKLKVEEVTIPEVKIVGPLKDVTEGEIIGERIVVTMTSGKKGVMDVNGHYIVAPQWDQISYKKGDEVIGVAKNGLWGCTDLVGNMMVAPRAAEPMVFSEGLCKQQVNGKFGYVDRNGQWVIKPQYVRAGDFHEGLAAVEVPKFWGTSCGFIDRQGQWKFKTDYYSEEGFHEGRAACVCYLVDKSGRIVGTQDYLQPVHNGYAVFCEEDYDLCGAMDRQGNIVVKPNWQEMSEFSQDGFAVVEGQYLRMGVIRKDDKLVIDDVWRSIMVCPSGFGVQDDDGLWGYISKEGKMLARPQWRDIFAESEDLYPVYDGEKMGYMDTRGREVIKPQWTYVSQFCGGIAPVIQDWCVSFINKKGEVVLEPGWEDIRVGDMPGLLLAQKGGESYIVDYRRGNQQYLPNLIKISGGVVEADDPRAVSSVPVQCVKSEDESFGKILAQYMSLLEKEYHLQYSGAQVIYDEEEGRGILMWLQNKHCPEKAGLRFSYDQGQVQNCDVLLHIQEYQDGDHYVQIYYGPGYQMEV